MDRPPRGNSFRGRSPYHQSPRFHGEGGGRMGSPQQYSPHWKQRNPSPYYHNQGHFQHGGSPFSPSHRSPYDANSYSYSSTPVHHHQFRGGRRPFHRGRGRFNTSFGSPSSSKGADDIENWTSPEMWKDPWRHLTGNNGEGDSKSNSTATVFNEGSSTSTNEEGLDGSKKLTSSDLDASGEVINSECGEKDVKIVVNSTQANCESDGASADPQIP